MIRMHLRREAKKFARGDDPDPRALHGAEMPRLAELAAGAGKVRVADDDVAAGGAITFATEDPTY
jgi:hypothetical protein